MLAYLFALLTIYWSFKLFFCPQSIAQKIGYITGAISAVFLFFILPKQIQAIPLFICGIFLTILAVRSLNQTPALYPLSFLRWAAVYFMGAVLGALSCMGHYAQGQVIGRVVLKGHRKQVLLSTYPSALEKDELINSYEFELQDSRGKAIYTSFTPGDLIAVRAQIVTLKWGPSLLGLKHLYRLEMIHNGYYTAERYQKMPHIAYELPLKYPLFDCIWKHLFQRKNRIPGIQSFSLESCYFPLYRASDKEVKGTFELLVGPTGLTARPL